MDAAGHTQSSIFCCIFIHFSGLQQHRPEDPFTPDTKRSSMISVQFSSFFFRSELPICVWYEPALNGGCQLQTNFQSCGMGSWPPDQSPKSGTCALPFSVKLYSDKQLFANRLSIFASLRIVCHLNIPFTALPLLTMGKEVTERKLSPSVDNYNL